MVKYKNIIQAMDNYLTKCLTIAEMKAKLGEMGFESQFQQLKEQNLLNPLEIDDYNNNLILIQSNMGDEETENILFQYGRRLFEGVKKSEPPVIDRSSFTEDEQFPWRDLLRKQTELIGDLEIRQIESQDKAITLKHKDYDYKIDERKVAMDCYFNGNMKFVQSSINNQTYLEKIDDEQRKNIKLIDSLMDESDGLIENTVLYRGGYWDIHLNVGDHSKGFNGYQSATFQNETADTYKQHYDLEKFETGLEYPPKGMKIKMYAPKGMKGICGNDTRFFNGFMEHEFVLPRNKGFTVLSINYDKMEAEVLLDGD